MTLFSLDSEKTSLRQLMPVLPSYLMYAGWFYGSFVWTQLKENVTMAVLASAFIS